MANFSITDAENMSLALRLAAKGNLGVKGNPMVGCVISKDNQIIAQGYHQTYGENHAEINALDEINHQADGATLYVSLEPCSHQGKTPPCAQAIINAGVKRVVIAMLDPNPLVSGRGVAMLEAVGIKVSTGLLEDQARKLNRGFIKRMVDKRPFVTCKVGMSLDGKTSMASGESKWITSSAARADVQRLRARHQAIMTGSGTVVSDNPSMTVRLKGVEATPLRVVIDSKGSLQDQSLKIFSDDAPTLVFAKDNAKLNDQGKIDLTSVLESLAEQEINTVLLEAGPGLVGAMLEAKLIDELVIYSAPVIMGSNANSFADLPIQQLSEKLKLKIQDVRMLGDDLKLTAIIDD